MDKSDWSRYSEVILYTLIVFIPIVVPLCSTSVSSPPVVSTAGESPEEGGGGGGGGDSCGSYEHNYHTEHY